MTWAALDRKAAAPPALPGYGVEDQDHPAHDQDDPGSAPYMIGGPSEFAEDVHPGPYGDSGPPAIPGYGVEDQDHPAHQGQVGRQASLMEMVRRKSAKALVLAKATLTSNGRKASWDAIEDQAFGFMSMDDSALDASIGRLGGDFMGMEDELMGMFPDDGMDMDLDDGMDMGLDDGMDMDLDDGTEGLMARLSAMESELKALRAAASQNDPNGQTIGASGETAEQEKAEEKAISNINDKAANPVMAMFDAFDSDGDGFVTAEDWGGPRAMFASMDTDRDGIIARHEVLAGCEKLPEALRDNCEKKKDEGSDKEACGDDLMGDEFDDDEMEMLAAMRVQASDDEDEDDVEVAGKKAKKADDDEDEDDADAEVEAAKKAAKKALMVLKAAQAKKAAKKAEDEPDADDDDDEGVEAGKKKASDDEDEDEDDEDGSDKEADAHFFATGFDPMGLADGTNLTAADEAAFREVFGSDDEDADDEGGDSDKEASARLASILKPQPKKASKGVKTVGAVRSKAASANGDIHELSNLWASDPDVSGSFS